MSSITTRIFSAADLEIGMALKTEAGWNQREADWRRAIDLQPNGCFVGCWDGRPVGTVTTCVFGGSVAWIAMMLVSAEMRGQGIGRVLMQTALDYLDGCGVATIRLDATPLGRPLYEKLGFVADFELHRYAGTPTRVDSCEASSLALRACHGDDLVRVADLDRQITKTERERLLRRQFADEANYGWVVEHRGEIVGYQSKRSGTNATQIGPCLAAESDAGRQLLMAALKRHEGEALFVDVPLANSAACKVLTGAGLVTQRPLTRMTRGAPIDETPVNIWGSFGPEKG